MYELNSDDEVLRYTGNSAFGSVEDARGFLSNYNNYKKNGYGRWVVINKESKEFLGWCGLKYHSEGFTDIGFRFHRKYWGTGYATESANSVLEYAFNTLGLTEIIGRASQDNIASIKVLEKIGMKFWKIDSCDGIPNSVYYKIENLNTRNTKMNKNLSVTHSIEIDGSPADVWDAMTNPNKIKVYLYGTETITDWKVGSPIIFQGEYEGHQYKDKGNVLENEPNKLLKYNYWSGFSGAEDIPENYQIITYKIDDIGDGKTVFTWYQEGFQSEENMKHSQDGMPAMLEQIKYVVEG